MLFRFALFCKTPCFVSRASTEHFMYFGDFRINFGTKMQLWNIHRAFILNNQKNEINMRIDHIVLFIHMPLTYVYVMWNSFGVFNFTVIRLFKVFHRHPLGFSARPSPRISSVRIYTTHSYFVMVEFWLVIQCSRSLQL